jgi:SAM-dependent methyltransferase
MADLGAGIEWQPVTRREQLLTLGADVSGDGLEIGAANNPIIRSPRCRYADYADTETLRARFRESAYHGTDSIVDVDYVWAGSGPLQPIVGEQRFDFVIASHVIEHVPNPLGWFRGIAAVIRPGGVFNLAIPDQRFTFDLACPSSSLGELIEADLLNYSRPSARQIFDNCYYGKAVDPGEPWVRSVDPNLIPSYSANATQLAYVQAVESLEGKYFDSHCWAFTPRSLLLLLRGACDLRLFDYLISDYHPTIEGEFEFFLNLEKPGLELTPDQLRDIQIQRIDFLLDVISDRDRKLRLLME